MKDIPAFHATFDEVAKEERFLLSIAAPPLERVEAFVSNNIANDYPQYVAFFQDQLIAWADIIPYQKASITHTGKLGMGVLKAHRGKTLGTQLLAKVTSHAWSCGLTRLELEVFADNEPAIHLYKKFGYQLEGRKKYARYVNESYQDILFMAQYRV